MEQPARKPAPMVSLAAGAAVAVTLAVVSVPWLRGSVESPSLKVALETAGALVAVATVVLLLRQCGLSSRADHVWLSVGLVVLAVTALTVSTLIVAHAWTPGDVRFAMGANLAGTLMLAVAAYAPARPLRVRRRSLWLAAAAAGLALAALAALVAGGGATGQPQLGRLGVQIAVAASLVVAAAGLARRAERRGEPFLRWLAAAVILGACAKLNYALFPPLHSDAVRVGDALRLLGWVVLLAGVVGEVRRRARARAETALAGERRRLARELHDGVAQELAFIRRRAGRLAELPDGREILSAAERALADSRRAIEALVPSAAEPLGVALERHGARLAAECDVEVQVNVRVRTDVAPEVRAEIFRIVAEAVRNAAHHGGARHVRVELGGSPLHVRVIDDGCGFRDGSSSGLGVAGYGLIAMRERAEQVGGQFNVESVRGAGTLVQVVLP
jgi:signal transduction histidine kinase